LFYHFLDSVAQVDQFINEAFIPFDPRNNAVYNLEHLTTKDIFRIVSLYTNYFDDRNLKTSQLGVAEKTYIFSKQLK
jgi:hypothetical protein